MSRGLCVWPRWRFSLAAARVGVRWTDSNRSWRLRRSSPRCASLKKPPVAASPRSPPSFSRSTSRHSETRSDGSAPTRRCQRDGDRGYADASQALTPPRRIGPATPRRSSTSGNDAGPCAVAAKLRRDVAGATAVAARSDGDDPGARTVRASVDLATAGTAPPPAATMLPSPTLSPTAPPPPVIPPSAAVRNLA
jgi:hypothetical protein